MVDGTPSMLKQSYDLPLLVQLFNCSGGKWVIVDDSPTLKLIGKPCSGPTSVPVVRSTSSNSLARSKAR